MQASMPLSRIQISFVPAVALREAETLQFAGQTERRNQVGDPVYSCRPNARHNY